VFGFTESDFQNFSLKMDDTIKVGQYIIVQRQNFTKLHKFSALDSIVSLGKELVELKNIADQNFFQTFKMKLKTSGKKRLYELEVCDNATNLKDILISIESGSDNRNILDDGKVKTPLFRNRPSSLIHTSLFSRNRSRMKKSST
jgi:hypothetical protein